MMFVKRHSLASHCQRSTPGHPKVTIESLYKYLGRRKPEHL